MQCGFNTSRIIVSGLRVKDVMLFKVVHRFIQIPILYGYILYGNIRMLRQNLQNQQDFYLIQAFCEFTLTCMNISALYPNIHVE